MLLPSIRTVAIMTMFPESRARNPQAKLGSTCINVASQSRAVSVFDSDSMKWNFDALCSLKENAVNKVNSLSLRYHVGTVTMLGQRLQQPNGRLNSRTQNI